MDTLSVSLTMLTRQRSPFHAQQSIQSICFSYCLTGSLCCTEVCYSCILGRTYFVERSIHLIEEHWLLIITGVQASGVIIDRLLRQCCFVWSEIVGPHSSGNFNDWPLKLKAGSKYSDALRDSIYVTDGLCLSYVTLELWSTYLFRCMLFHA